jgi:hypothetical protein
MNFYVPTKRFAFALPKHKANPERDTANVVVILHQRTSKFFVFKVI